jgi:hypothetical protein
MRNHNRNRDWKAAADECLTAALDRAREMVDKAEDHKSLESLIKTVAEVVGFGTGINRGSGNRTAGGESDDD